MRRQQQQHVEGPGARRHRLAIGQQPPLARLQFEVVESDPVGGKAATGRVVMRPAWSRRPGAGVAARGRQSADDPSCAAVSPASPHHRTRKLPHGTPLSTRPRPATRWTPRLWRWHRLLAWLVALQVLAWVVGGALFAWLPFQAWVKSADSVARPSASLPAGWSQALARAEQQLATGVPVLSVASVPTAAGPAWQIRRAGGADVWLAADGQPLPAPDEAAVRAFARQLYRGSAALQAVQRLAQPPRRLGIVREAGDRADLWVVRFGDALATRIYVDARTGQFVAARNEAWVLYDFFWRLHVMDYDGGEDFNNPLLRVAALAALALVASGTALLALSLGRRRRRAVASAG